MNFELYINFKDLLLFQNGLFLFYWHHFAFGTLVSVSLSWSLSWHHYDTYSCWSICFQKPEGAIELGAGLFSVHTVEGRPAQSCTRSDLHLKSAQAIFVFHNRNCFELCTMCVFKLLVEFFNEWALYVAKSGLKVFWRILNGKPYSLIGQSCMGFSTIEDGNLSRGLY